MTESEFKRMLAPLDLGETIGFDPAHKLDYNAAIQAIGEYVADNTVRKLAAKPLVDMKTAATTHLYAVPTGKKLILDKIVVHTNTGSLVGGSNYSITGFRTGFSLAALDATGSSITVREIALAKCTVLAAAAAVDFVVTTGASAAGTATIEVWGNLLDA